MWASMVLNHFSNFTDSWPLGQRFKLSGLIYEKGRVRRHLCSRQASKVFTTLRGPPRRTPPVSGPHPRVFVTRALDYVIRSSPASLGPLIDSTLIHAKQ